MVVRAGSVASEVKLTGDNTNGVLEWIDGRVDYGDGPIYHIHHEAEELVYVLELAFFVASVRLTHLVVN